MLDIASAKVEGNRQYKHYHHHIYIEVSSFVVIVFFHDFGTEEKMT
jgi:hypothetical protein